MIFKFLNRDCFCSFTVLSVEATRATASRSFSPGAATTSSLATTESVFPWITGGSHNWTFVALLLLRCDNIFHCRDGSDETKCSLLRKVLMSIIDSFVEPYFESFGLWSAQNEWRASLINQTYLIPKPPIFRTSSTYKADMPIQLQGTVDKTAVEFSVTIRKILHVDEVGKSMTVQFQSRRRWLERQLTFQNLKLSDDLNVDPALSQQSGATWFPWVDFYNIESNNKVSSFTYIWSSRSYFKLLVVHIGHL